MYFLKFYIFYVNNFFSKLPCFSSELKIGSLHYRRKSLKQIKYLNRYFLYDLNLLFSFLKLLLLWNSSNFSTSVSLLYAFLTFLYTISNFFLISLISNYFAICYMIVYLFLKHNILLFVSGMQLKLLKCNQLLLNKHRLTFL